ncbi:MAG: glyoxalase [Ignavibacteria bacterium]|nr:MAG: glyoxalase [Ignavibacteria bacterium]
MNTKTITYRAVLITVRDMERARWFYEELLGQTVEHDFGEDVSYHGGFALHDAAHFAALLEEGTGYVEEQRPGCPGMELYFECEDLEQLARRLRREEIRFVHEIREQPWAQHVMRVKDPDGWIVEIGEPMPAVVRRLAESGLDAATIARRTSLPDTAVSAMLVRFRHTQEQLF